MVRGGGQGVERLIFLVKIGTASDTFPSFFWAHFCFFPAIHFTHTLVFVNGCVITLHDNLGGWVAGVWAQEESSS